VSEYENLLKGKYKVFFQNTHSLCSQNLLSEPGFVKRNRSDSEINQF